MMLGNKNLFAGQAIPDEARTRVQQALTALKRVDIDTILTTDIDVLIDAHLDEFGTATVLWDDASTTEPKQLDTVVTRDVIGNQVHTAHVQITVTAPVEGDPYLLTYYSHSGAPGMPLEGAVGRSGVQGTWTGDAGAGAQAIEHWFHQFKSQVDHFLGYNNRDVAPHNERMRTQVRNAVERWRQEELKRRDLAASLPFPIKRNPTATAPVKAERRKVRLPPRAATPFEPEPELEAQTFDEVLTDVVNMSTILERLPTGDQDEEEIRNLLLAQLNVNYTGEAGGELFNGSGKTDILIRKGDRNVFIAECKFYNGPASVTKAINQLLSYTVWRDTKAALLLFVKGGQFTDVVTKAVDAVSEHPQCQRTLTAADPARRSDYTYVRADDPERAIHLAMLPFKLLS
ncbi:hypothetical protein [Nocardioides terrigena]|uniref:hypothetical protein n=1 Tax=Nocardioides terrigena TaxID=424797 RepID=UPI00131F027A|nr:hypothetical protein [Nocardioides terrigena]